jgi:hypothetical protein
VGCEAMRLILIRLISSEVKSLVIEVVSSSEIGSESRSEVDKMGNKV